MSSCLKNENGNINFDYNRITGNYITQVSGQPDTLNFYNIEMSLIRDGDTYYFLSDKQLYDPVANLKFELIPCYVESNGSYYNYVWANIILILDDKHVQPSSSFFNTPVNINNNIKYWDHFQGDGARFSITFQDIDSLGTNSYIRISGDRDY
jgi:type IV secretory pathway ATPase VirB11/archaellum biosynthesis ATPase